MNITATNRYTNDKLNRGEFCSSIIKLINNQINEQNGLFLSLNGGCGNGKSVALNLLEDSITTASAKMIVVKHNASSNNLHDNPVVSILCTFIETLKSDHNLSAEGKKLQENSRNLIKMLCLQNKNNFEEIIEFNSIINEFKTAVSMIISSNDVNITLLIDEIDYCSPKLALQILENIKCLFNIKGIATLIAFNRDQLEKNIEIIYGQNSNVCGYIHKYIDLQFELPKSKIEVNNLLANKLKAKASDELNSILDAFNFGLREKLKICNEFSLLTDNFLHHNNDYDCILFMILLCAKRKHNKFYNSLIRDYSLYRSKLDLADSNLYKFYEYIKMFTFFNNQFIRDDYFKRYLLTIFGIEISKLKIQDVAKCLDVKEEYLHKTGIVMAGDPEVLEKKFFTFLTKIDSISI